MKVVWIGIYDRGNIAQERVHFRALMDINLTHYCIIDTHYRPAVFLQPDQIDASNKNCYWFGPSQVKANQNIVVYTRAGVPNTETRPDGSFFHFHFRGLKEPIYQQLEKCAVLCELNDWITTPR